MLLSCCVDLCMRHTWCPSMCVCVCVNVLDLLRCNTHTHTKIPTWKMIAPAFFSLCISAIDNIRVVKTTPQCEKHTSIEPTANRLVARAPNFKKKKHSYTSTASPDE